MEEIEAPNLTKLHSHYTLATLLQAVIKYYKVRSFHHILRDKDNKMKKKIWLVDICTISYPKLSAGEILFCTMYFVFSHRSFRHCSAFSHSS
jgi:hypothetical protein